MNTDRVAIHGLHGASHTCPADTVTAYWAALGAGADGIVAGLELTGGGTVVCCPAPTLQAEGGVAHEVLGMKDEDFFKFDAGASFRSAVLDAQNQPTGERGDDTPWKGTPNKKKALSHPTLLEVLQLFGRRCRVMLLLRGDQGPDASKSLADKTLQLLRDTGLTRRVVLIAPQDTCNALRRASATCRLACIGEQRNTLAQNVSAALAAGAQYLYARVEDVIGELGECRKKLPVPLLLTSDDMPLAPSPEVFDAFAECESVAGFCFPAVEATVELRTPPACVLSDSFEGTDFDRDLWACGYSHQNADTKITQSDGVNIEIKEDGQYSGAAAVTVLPIHDRFDARVDFEVASPAQGTTFEMAAIGIDPGYFNIDNTKLDSKTVNLTFDVHGAPPYASAERDEDDGFRVGWNNGFNLTKIDPDWAAASGNMYNKYGRDVGDGSADSPRGTLRMVRTGAVFNAYYQDKHNRAWVCCGSALVPNLGPDVHIRLGAKHWPKTGKPPRNTVTFTNFRLYQF